MMGRIFEQPFFLKVARLIAIGVIILREFQDDYEPSHRLSTEIGRAHV